MLNDIKKPSNPYDKRRQTLNKERTMHLPAPEQDYAQPQPSGHNSEPPKPKKSWGKSIAIILGFFILLAIAAALIGWVTYNNDQDPVNASNKDRTRVEIASGSTPRQIANLLAEKDLIRSAGAFELYTRLNGTRDKLQAGVYNLSQSMPMSEIVDHLTSGKTDSFRITFYPGGTLTDSRLNKQKESKTDVTSMLLDAGYKQEEISAALEKKYSHPLLKDRPENASLEGYIYGDTYEFDSSYSVEQIFEKVFDHYYDVIQKNNLVEGFKRQNLNLHQGIIMASIVQKEVSKNYDDQRQVAQIFLKRLKEGTVLGSDATFVYGAHVLGVEPRLDVVSPYNTRKLAGLTPGPIASPGEGALKAVANPAPGDYEYFVSGDDGKNYFAYTEAEHNQNIKQHCVELCKMF